MVAYHENTLIPVGRAMIIVAAVKYALVFLKWTLSSPPVFLNQREEPAFGL